MTQVWDRWAIYAEARRRGTSLKEIMEKNNLNASASTSVFSSPFYPAAEIAISDFLNIPAKELWPERYNKDGTRIYFNQREYYLNKKKELCKCQNSKVA
jgi:Ner family transcriptional regulator